MPNPRHKKDPEYIKLKMLVTRKRKTVAKAKDPEDKALHAKELAVMEARLAKMAQDKHPDR
jgi:hypothetical protein